MHAVYCYAMSNRYNIMPCYVCSFIGNFALMFFYGEDDMQRDLLEAQNYTHFQLKCDALTSDVMQRNGMSFMMGYQ